MIPHIHTLFKFISIPYENQHQTLNVKKIDRGHIKFREYSITLLQPNFANRFYSLKSGELVDEVTTEDDNEIQALCKPCAGFPRMGYVTRTNIYMLQVHNLHDHFIVVPGKQSATEGPLCHPYVCASVRLFSGTLVGL